MLGVWLRVAFWSSWPTLNADFPSERDRSDEVASKSSAKVFLLVHTHYCSATATWEALGDREVTSPKQKWKAPLTIDHLWLHGWKLPVPVVWIQMQFLPLAERADWFVITHSRCQCMLIRSRSSSGHRESAGVLFFCSLAWKIRCLAWRHYAYFPFPIEQFHHPSR